MDGDGAAAQNGRGIAVVSHAKLVIVDDAAGDPVPYLHTELVHAAATVHLAVYCREHEVVAPCAVDRAVTSELRPRPRDHQPVVALRVEVEVARGELKLGRALWRLSATSIL